MKQQATMPNASTAFQNINIDGLSLSGIVIDRTRRHVPKDNPTTEIVTYTIQDMHDRKWLVDDYAPNGYHELGSTVTLPIFIKAYQRKNGELAYTLNVQKLDPSRGEHF